MKKVYWLSRHELSAAQKQAIRDLHGDVEIVKDPVTFKEMNSLGEYIKSCDGFVYAVGGAHHYLAAALDGLSFGVFENHPQKRQDGMFGLAAVYHIRDEKIQKVWINTDPASDTGEALIPVAH